MTQLLQIEQNFLRLPQVAEALQLQELRSVQRTITNAKKKKFEQTLALSAIVVKGFEWFQSEAGAAVLREEGITWSTEDFAGKVFGWQKSYFYKVVKAGKLEASVVDEFRTKCDAMEREGAEPDRSLAGLLKFAKVVEETAAAGGQEGTDEEGTEGEGEAQPEARPQTIFTMTLKHPDGNISVRISDAGELKTTNTPEQIMEAITFLTTAMFEASNTNQ
jgi:hypothetical protein